MNAATTRHLRITGIGIIAAALFTTWAFGQKPNPVQGGVPAAPAVATATASGAPGASTDPTVERGRYLARAGDYGNDAAAGDSGGHGRQRFAALKFPHRRAG